LYALAAAVFSPLASLLESVLELLSHVHLALAFAAAAVIVTTNDVTTGAFSPDDAAQLQQLQSTVR
jgi:hypothetical protein